MPQAALGRLQLHWSIAMSNDIESFDAASGIRSVATSAGRPAILEARCFDAASGIRSVATLLSVD